jgi:hypothetical protein
MAKFDFDASKKDKMNKRRKARKVKMDMQEAPLMDAPEPAYASGGAVRGMGSAQRGGKYKSC